MTRDGRSIFSVERYLLRSGEKALERYRAEAAALKQEVNYQEYLPKIQKALQEATYWHGTGKYQYRHAGDSRYAAITNKKTDVFASILDSDGLKPYLDPWLDSGGKTVSLGTARMHSRVFARIHLYEGDTMHYELGSIKFWVRFYSALLFIWLFGNLYACRDFLKTLFRRSTPKAMQTWASAIRNPHGSIQITIRNAWKGLIISSDIEGNYPVLIGIAKKNVNVMATIVLTNAVEVRTFDPIRIGNMTHVEVPLANVVETEDFLAEKGVSLPVLPMEYVDAYVSDIPLNQLAFS